MTADVRVGIVSWNTAELLDRCLTALPESLDGLSSEVVVVDNASDDASREIIRAHGVRLIENADNVGYALAMNQALAGSDAEVLIALNPDTTPPPGSLARLVTHLREHPTVGVVVPRLVGDDGRLQHSVYRFPSPSVAAVVSFVPPRRQRGTIGERWWLEGGAPHDRTGTVEWAIGAVHVIRRSALDGRPPYSDRWFMYAEDIELCWRLGQRGWSTLFVADTTIPHHGNAAGAQAWGSTRATRYWAATYDLYAGIHGPLAARWFALVNVVGVGYHLVGNLVGSIPRTGARARRQAVALDLAKILRLHVRAFVLGPGRLGPIAGVRAGTPARYSPS